MTEGFEARTEDIERPASLLHEHVNLLGRYQIPLPEDLLRGALRRSGILEDD